MAGSSAVNHELQTSLKTILNESSERWRRGCRSSRLDHAVTSRCQFLQRQGSRGLDLKLQLTPSVWLCSVWMLHKMFLKADAKIYFLALSSFLASLFSNWHNSLAPCNREINQFEPRSDCFPSYKRSKAVPQLQAAYYYLTVCTLYKKLRYFRVAYQQEMCYDTATLELKRKEKVT